jgi:hypothetical protein
MKPTRTQVPLRIQRAEDVVRYGYDIQSDFQAADPDVSTPRRGGTLFQLLAAVALTVVFVTAFLVNLVIEGVGDSVHRN